mgnify:CR=1 FL=1|jgi:GntR family transcriptional regulator
MKILLSNSSPHPIYEQITRQIGNLIVSGELSPGDALPSIRALARDLQVSIITVKRAYEEMEKAGLLDTVSGKGSYVAVRSDEFIREQQRRRVEEGLSLAIEQGRIAGMEYSELEETLRLLWEENI